VNTPHGFQYGIIHQIRKKSCQQQVKGIFEIGNAKDCCELLANGNDVTKNHHNKDRDKKRYGKNQDFFHFLTIPI